MPIFDGVYCAKKFAFFAGVVIFGMSIVAYIVASYLGLALGFGVIGICIVLLWYFADQYGDNFLLDSKYRMGKDEMTEFGKKELVWKELERKKLDL